MDVNIQKYSSNRKTMLVVFFAIVGIIRCQNWVLPSPLMPYMMKELSLSYAQSGQLIFIVAVIMGIFLFAGSFIIDRLGPGLTMTLGMLALAADGFVSSSATNYAMLFFGRVLCGVGFGFTVGAIPVFISSDFSARGQAYANSFNTSMNPVGMAICYAIAIPLFTMLGTWQNVYLLWGVLSLVCAIGFYIFDRKNISTFFTKKGLYRESDGSKFSLMEAARIKELWPMALAMAGALWAYNCFSTYLPTFLSQIKGVDLGTASSLTALMQIAGVGGCFIWSFVYTKTRNRKFLIVFPLVVMLAVYMGTAFLPAGVPLYICILFAGISYYALASVLTTAAMQIDGMKPQLMAGAVAIFLGVGSLSSVAAPVVFGAIEQQYGMQAAFFVFSLIIIPSIAGGLMLKRQSAR